MKKLLLLLFLVVGICSITPASHASIGYPYGSNCTGGCGIGTGFVVSSIKCQLYDTNPNNPPFDCPTTLADYSNSYYANLPKTIDPTKFWMSACTTMPTTMGYVLGAELNNSDRTFWDAASPTGPFNISTCHKILVEHTVPASSSGTGAGPTTGYFTANPNGTASDPLSNYSLTLINYPGPQAYQGGLAGYFQIQTPNPPASFPLAWEGTAVGTNSVTRGYPVTIPLNILWKNANAVNVAGLGGCTVGQLGHVYQAGSPSAPNSGTWYTGKLVNGACAWTHSTLPVFVATTLQLEQNGTIYPCPGSSFGGYDPNLKQVRDFCTSTNGVSLNTSVTPLYTGIWSGNFNEYYRQINYSSKGYSFDTNGASPPSNAVPTSALMVWPSTNAPLGIVNGTATFTTYTDSSLTQIATGTPTFTVNFSVNITDEVPVVESRPTNPSVDNTEQAYYAANAADGTLQCSSITGNYGPAYWQFALHSALWGPFSPTNFGEVEYWNYDGPSSYQSISDMLMQQANGQPWNNWTPNTTFGNNEINLAIKPITDINGNVWVVKTPGESGTTEPNWVANNKPGTILADGNHGLTWINAQTQVYWNSCIVNSGTEYLNNLNLTNGSVGQFTNFAKSIHRNVYRTANSVAKDGTVVTGLYNKSIPAMINAGIGVGVFSQFSQNAGRGDAYPLMTDSAQYQEALDNGTVSQFVANQPLMATIFWQQNNTFNFWNIHENDNPYSPDDTKTFVPTLDPLHIGTGIEGVLELWAVCQRDNNNSHHVCDDRIIPEVKKIADYIYVYWYNQCAKNGGPNNWGMSYNPKDFQNCTILEPYFTELEGTAYPVYDFLYAFCGGNPTACSAPDGTTYDVIADEIRMHSYDGRANCSNLSCRTYSIPWAGGAGTPKVFGQICKYGCGVSEKLRKGGDPTIDDMAPQSNPCWDTRTIPCAVGTLHPYAATKPDYMVQLNTSGAQSDPSCENHYTGLACSPLQNLGLNGVTVQFNTYGKPKAAWVNYGKTNACSDGSISTQPTGFPKLQPVNTELWLSNFNITGLASSTTYWFQLCTTSAANVTMCNNCAQTTGGFLGGNIHATTLPSTVVVSITPLVLPSATLGVQYFSTLTGNGGTGPYTFTNVTPLPANLTLSPAGLVQGIPNVLGTLSFIARACDSNSACGTATIQITVNVPPLVLASAILPNAIVGFTYPTRITATGGYPPYTYAKVSGSLPVGLTLNPDGSFSGTAKITSTITKFTFVVQVTDSHNQTAQGTFTITVVVKSTT